jgi:hypothetical protein
VSIRQKVRDMILAWLDWRIEAARMRTRIGAVTAR